MTIESISVKIDTLLVSLPGSNFYIFTTLNKKNISKLIYAVTSHFPTKSEMISLIEKNIVRFVTSRPELVNHDKNINPNKRLNGA